MDAEPSYGEAHFESSQYTIQAQGQVPANEMILPSFGQ